MSKQDEKKLESLTNQVVQLLSNIHELEITLSRVKNEGEELLRKLMGQKRKG